MCQSLEVAYHTLCTVFPFELMSGLVCHPEYKLLIFCNIPQVSSSTMAYSVFTWPGLLQHQHQMLTAFCMLLFNKNKMKNKNLCVAIVHLSEMSAVLVLNTMGKHWLTMKFISVKFQNN